MTRVSLFKELKNPVHGDKNKSDDVSWPFYGAIDEVLGYGQRNNDTENDDDLNPHEFLCISVTPEEPGSPDEEKRLDSDVDHETSSSVRGIKRIRNFNQDFSIEIERPSKVPIRRARTLTRPSQICQELRFRDDASEVLVSRLPPATELSIKTVKSSSSSSLHSSLPGLRVRKFSNNKEERDDSPRQFLRDALAVTNNKLINGNHTLCNYNNEIEEEEVEVEIEEEEGEGDENEEEQEEEEDDNDNDNDDVDGNEERERPRKLLKRLESSPPTGSLLRVNKCANECGILEKRLTKFIEYTKRRDEENRIIMTRILNAVERIADKN